MAYIPEFLQKKKQDTGSMVKSEGTTETVPSPSTQQQQQQSPLLAAYNGCCPGTAEEGVKSEPENGADKVGGIKKPPHVPIWPTKYLAMPNLKKSLCRIICFLSFVYF